MDYGAPKHWQPSKDKRGVGEHPHRGFETVTFAYQGAVDHRDSHGGGGTIQAGDVQWMTAGSGVVHEEMHSRDFVETGGVFEMVQLWANLPKHLKMVPALQALRITLSTLALVMPCSTGCWSVEPTRGPAIRIRQSPCLTEFSESGTAHSAHCADHHTHLCA